MKLSFFNSIIKIFKRQPPVPSLFEQHMADLIKKSNEAIQELTSESFNSETLKTLCRPDFMPQHPNCLMAVSTKLPYTPVEVCYRKTQKDSIVSVEIYHKGQGETILGRRDYYLTSDESGKPIMLSGNMSSDEEACKKLGIKLSLTEF